MPGVGPGGGLRLDNLQRQPHRFGAHGQRQRIAQRQLALAFRAQLKLHLTLGKGFSGGLDLPAQRFVIGGAEQIFAADADTQRGLRKQGKLEVLLRVFRFN